MAKTKRGNNIKKIPGWRGNNVGRFHNLYLPQNYSKNLYALNYLKI